MKMQLVVGIIFVLSLYANASEWKGPVGNITITSVYLCDNYKSDPKKFSVSLDFKSVDPKGTKGLFANITSNIVIDFDVTYVVDLSVWVTSGWKKLLTYKGSLCEHARIYAYDIVVLMEKALNPPGDLSCPVSPGTYNIENLQVSVADLHLPITYYGQLLLKLEVSSENNVIHCVNVEGLSQAPE